LGQEFCGSRSATTELCRNHMLADVAAIIGVIDIVFGKIDR
jgi:NADH:ubiquinone oxidoreductase subunit D